MEYIDLQEAKKQKKGFFSFGTGTTANCYMMKDGQVLKLYRSTSRKDYMFYLFDGMTKHLEELGQVSNISYVGPKQIILKGGNECAGYTYQYRPAPILDKLNRKLQIKDMLTHYNILEDDTAKISDTGFYLNDLHSANMLYDQCFYIIDLDMGTFSDKEKKKIFEHNMHEINATIVYGILGLPQYYKIVFKDPDLQELYSESIYRDYHKISELLESLKYRKEKLETIGEVRNKAYKLINVEDYDYYNNF